MGVYNKINIKISSEEHRLKELVRLRKSCFMLDHNYKNYMVNVYSPDMDLTDIKQVETKLLTFIEPRYATIKTFTQYKSEFS